MSEIIVFWDVTTSDLVEIYRRLGETCCYHLQSGRQRQNIPPKHWQSPTRLNGVTFEKTVIFIATTMTTSHLSISLWIPTYTVTNKYHSNKSLKRSIGIQRSVVIRSLVTITAREDVANKCEWNSVPLSVSLEATIIRTNESIVLRECENNLIIPQCTVQSPMWTIHWAWFTGTLSHQCNSRAYFIHWMFYATTEKYLAHQKWIEWVTRTQNLDQYHHWQTGVVVTLWTCSREVFLSSLRLSNSPFINRPTILHWTLYTLTA
jgi:hypothetical protein